MKNKQAYLTIDDSPSLDMEEKIDYLWKRGIPAAFFCIGNLMEERPEAIIYAIKKGFFICNHSYSHPHFSSISVEACCREIERTDAIIEDLYFQADVPRPAKCFRFPYGDKGDFRYGKIFETYSIEQLGRPIRLLKKFPSLFPNIIQSRLEALAKPYIKKLTDEGQRRKQEIQQYLQSMGYSIPNLPKVSYDFYQQHGLHLDYDLHWTYDIMEWSIYHQQPIWGIDSIQAMTERMDSTNPPDIRGPIQEEKWGLHEQKSDEIVLLHDHVESSPYFQDIIDQLVSRDIEFADLVLQFG